MTTRLALAGMAALAAAYLATTLLGGSDDSVLARQPCRFTQPEDWEASCFRLTVPESHSRNTDQRVSLPVVMLEPAGGAESKLPVLHLLGGPGQPAGLKTGRDIAAWGQHLSGLAWSRGRAHIFFDPRGVGPLASPQLRCAILSDMRWSLALDRLDKGSTAWKEKLEGPVRMCRDAFLKAGIDLSAFSTAETAADLIALRQRMQVDRWVLYGVSYGTQLALELMARDPDGVAAAVLDGLDPPHIATMAGMIPNLRRSLTLLFADCEGEPACNAAFPDLDAALERIIHRLRETPVELTLRPRNMGKIVLTANDEIFLEGLEYALSTTDWLRFTPALITAMDKGDTGLFAYLATQIVGDPYYKGNANGLALSVRCGGELPQNTPEDFAKARAGDPLLSGFDIETSTRMQCAVWLPDAPKAAPLPPPVESTAPTLLLSGAYDTRTPPTYALSQQQTLPNSHLLIIRDQSHGVSLSSPCAQAAMAAFLDAPRAYQPPACTEQQRPPRFVTDVLIPSRVERLTDGR